MRASDEKKNITFSIVITTCNCLKFLKRAIDSALQQTVPCEVVVVDDFSCDETQKYCKNIKDIKYVRNKNRMGQCFSVNKGVKAAKGDWIKFLDDDDYLEKDCIENLKRIIEKAPNAVICSCGYVSVDEKGRRLDCSNRKANLLIPHEYVHYGMLLDYVNFGTTSQVAAKRSAFLKSGGWNVRFITPHQNTETFSWLKIADYGDGILVKKQLMRRTKWSGGRNEGIPLKTRMKANFIIKKAIYYRVNQNKPSLETVENYMKLHWFLAGVMRGKVMESGLDAVFSLKAWALLIKARLSKSGLYKDPNMQAKKIE